MEKAPQAATATSGGAGASSVAERGLLIAEIVKTEKKYITTLEVIVKHFLGPLKDMASIKPEILSEKARRRIFPSSLATLLKVHTDFYGKLINRLLALKAQAQKTTDRVHLFLGDLFLEMSPFLKLYPMYVADFEMQQRYAKEEKAKNPLFASFLERQFKVVRDPSQDLGALLVAPVHRIPRYLILLRGVIKHTASSNPDYENLVKAANEEKDRENVTALMQLTEHFHGLPEHLFDGSRRLVFNKIVIVNPKMPKRRAFLLLSDFFILGRIGDDGTSYHYMSGASLEQCLVQRPHKVDDLHCFELTVMDGERTHLLIIGSEKKEESLALFKELDVLIRDVKLKVTTLRRKEKRESKSGGGSSGGPQAGSSIGRKIGKVLHRRGKSEQQDEFSPPISPSQSPRAAPIVGNTSPRDTHLSASAKQRSVPAAMDKAAEKGGDKGSGLLRGSTRTPSATALAAEEAGKTGSGKRGGKGHRRTQSSATWEEKKEEERSAVKPPSHFLKDSAKGSTDMFFESMSGYQREPPSPRNANIRNLDWDEI